MRASSCAARAGHPAARLPGGNRPERVATRRESGTMCKEQQKAAGELLADRANRQAVTGHAV
jgi:hypothetical protein